MKEVLEQLDSIQFDHSRWLNELLFSVKEIKLYQKRLVELVKTFGDNEKGEELMKMFTAFEKQKVEASKLKSKIKKHVINISQLTHSNGELKAMIDTNHNRARQDMETFRHQYTNLKETFHRFSALQD